ncbi:DEAD/DEAH box helicase [Caldicellulosiruptor sp. DIB 104C]|uniref:DEAD/DEAH box helicase n=1 Tax=Caldicellulosiruptor sp. DIB 104C TaxID=3019889 RepID=UPI00230640C7|nr:DEAD/DEAH box helicase [Caldicellulosiruptor sp. DIB 104C]
MFFSSFFKKSISVGLEYCKDGILVNIFLNLTNKKSVNISLPFEKNFILKKYLKRLTSDSHQKLIVLQQLWNDEIIQPYKENTYIISYDSLYKIDNQDRIQINLPKDINDLKIKIWSEGIFTSADFRLKYDLYLRSGKKINKYHIIENVLFFDNKAYLIEKYIFDLIPIVNKINQEKSKEKLAEYISLLQSKAKSENVILEDYLKNEEYLYVDEVDYVIKTPNKDEIAIEPVIIHQSEKTQEINQIFHSKDEYLEKVKTIPIGYRRIRIFSSNNAVEKFNTIKRLPKFKGPEIPKLIETPNLFLPDWIDIDEFSKRVKEIGIKVYHIKPIIKLNKDTKTGLFDLVGEIKFESSDNQYSEDAQIDEILPILESSNDEYVKIGDKWVRNNYNDIKNFKTKIEEIKSAYEETGFKIPESEIKFVLEIFDNITQLEYSETAINFKLQFTKEELEFTRPKFISENIEIKEFQKEGINWLKTLYKNSIGGILADEMGLGKTFQVIAFLAYLKEIEELKPSLIIVPNTLIKNWSDEIEKFAPLLKNNLYIHHNNNRLRKPEEIAKNDIVITTYDTLVRDQIILGKIDWKIVVCDEAQYIKNPDAYRTKAAKALKAKTRVALTGTPLENGLSEFWCIMDFVQPGLLDCYHNFKERFEDPIVNSDSNDSEKLIEELLSIIKPYYLRRTKDKNLHGLPKKFVISHRIEMTDYQKLLYSKIIADFKKSENKKQILLDTLYKLIYVCDFPEISIDDIHKKNINKVVKECAKVKKLIEILDEIKQKDEKVLIFTKFKPVQAMLSSIIQQRYGLFVNILNGEIRDSSRRKQMIDNFNQSAGFNVLILNTQVGGIGLNITSANHVIHYTREWNPAKEDQATDRVYRIGQQKDVYVYYLITTAPDLVKKTIDEHIHDLLQAKKELFKEVIVPNKFEISLEELEEVLDLDSFVEAKC